MTKVSSEAINRRRTDNAIDKNSNKDPQNITQKTKKSSNTNPTKIRGELICSGRVIGSCVTEKKTDARCCKLSFTWTERGILQIRGTFPKTIGWHFPKNLPHTSSVLPLSSMQGAVVVVIVWYFNFTTTCAISFWLGRLIFSVSINSYQDNIYISGEPERRA